MRTWTKFNWFMIGSYG